MKLQAISLGLGVMLCLCSCRGCLSSNDDITSVASDMITLQIPRPPEPPAPPAVPEPEIQEEPEYEPEVVVAEREPEYDPYEYDDPLDAQDALESLVEDNVTPVPPGTFESDDLTLRLKEKMAEAYSGDINKVPDAKIYLSNGTLEDFIDFYEERGYQVTRVTVPVRRILQPVLRDRPELADQIDIEYYADMEIHQVMVRGTGMSAADRYIDPDTYEVVEQLFVTEMPMQ